MFRFIKNLFSSPLRLVTPGAYYAIRSEETSYQVLKVLAVDEQGGKPYGVHIRLYGRRFAQPPTRVAEPEDLEVRAKIPSGENLTFGAALAAINQDEMTMGHLPYTYEAFLRMKPWFIQAGIVEESELEGYKFWKEESGGYWN